VSPPRASADKLSAVFSARWSDGLESLVAFAALEPSSLPTLGTRTLEDGGPSLCQAVSLHVTRGTAAFLSG
jgi:hypothetical protein